MTLSVILVNYRSRKELLGCLSSIFKQRVDFSFEVIVVDNDEPPTVRKALKTKFPQVKYFVAGKNLGFGAGCNLGAKKAQGNLLFFLNPDTIVFPSALEKLVKFLKVHRDVAVVAPLLLDKNNEVYPLQGTGKLTPLSAIFAFSFLNKIWPKNPFSKKYWLSDWDKKNIREVIVVPGTAFLIRKEIFEKIGGFDENFFLYFEESDLCKRVKEAGGKIFFEPKAKLIHLWTRRKRRSQKNKMIFQASRYYFFKKHYGCLPAIMVEFFLRIFEK
jgi:GT2 family glycosyltransferase